MQVADLDPNLFRAAGGALGALLGAIAGKLADALPRRYGITHLVTGPRRSRRNVALVVLSTLCSLAIAHMLAGAGDVSLARALFLLATNGVVASAVLAGAAIDLEHMILPNELTLGPAVLCLVTSPFRSVGLVGSVVGALVGLAIAYLPFLLYKRMRGQSGMGLGDAKLALMAGAWHGIAGAPFVLFLGALQSTLAAIVMRVAGLEYSEPESVKAEIRELRARAEAGDEEAKRELEDDPMAGDAREGTLGMRLPLGPFLALGCVEVLLLRRWLVDGVLDWLMR
ncbi:MAG: prepilin peptidase [Labilithrix sp.]|nr:prepilin peptidase [Labilithrix sp.]MBX3220221.1 prepilin peptidase [Labilithrix sp.]